MERAYRLRCLGLTYMQMTVVTGDRLPKCFVNAERYVEIHTPNVPHFPTLSETLSSIAQSDDLNAHRDQLKELAVLFRTAAEAKAAKPPK